MPSLRLKDAILRIAIGGFALLVLAASAFADTREKIRIPVGRSEVVTSTDEVRTVAIAEPRIADAAVGSQRTVIVSGKSEGSTTLVMYGEGGRYTIYDVDVFVPNRDKQVLLHVRVAEVNEQAKKELGWDFFANGNKDGFTAAGGILAGKVTELPVPPLRFGPVTDGLLTLNNRAGDIHFEMAWKALEEKGLVRMLANPTLLASSGDTASFLAGGEIPIPVASASGTGGSSITVVWKEYGIRVAFQPTVLEDGSISLRVAPEVSQLDFNNAIKLSDTVIPALISRRTSTTVRLNSGEHLVIGGLKQKDRSKNVRKVPILGSIPLLGFFFTTSRTETVERELLVVVSPEIQGQAPTTLPVLPTDRPESK